MGGIRKDDYVDMEGHIFELTDKNMELQRFQALRRIITNFFLKREEMSQ